MSDDADLAAAREAVWSVRERVQRLIVHYSHETGTDSLDRREVLGVIDDALAALPAHPPAPPRSYWMEFLAWEEEAARQGSGMTAEQKQGAALYRSWLVNSAPDDARPEAAPPAPLPLDVERLLRGHEPFVSIIGRADCRCGEWNNTETFAQHVARLSPEPVKVQAKAQGLGEHPVSRTNEG